MAVVGWVSLTYSVSDADEVDSGRIPSHVASLAGVAIVSESVSALGSVSTSQKARRNFGLRGVGATQAVWEFYNATR